MLKRTPPVRYRVAMALLFLPLLCHLSLRSRKDGGWRYFKERLGIGDGDHQPRLWIHAASVGEVITVIPLIEQLQQTQTAQPLRLLITTNTPAGAQIVEDRISGDVVHRYLPLDYAFAVKRFFKQHNVQTAWVVETEIWPWLYNKAKQAKIELTIINARLSPRSLTGIARYFKSSYAQALEQVRVLTKSETEVARYTSLGADENLVECVGNLKFAAPAHNHNGTGPDTALADPIVTRSFFLAASTHDDEEIRLAQAWLESDSNELLVIVPRHAERGTSLGKALRSLLKNYPNSGQVSLRSLGQSPEANDRLYLADTLGELNSLYAHALAVFVGGSLISRGGHNVLEAARLAKPIVVGPSTYNFKDEVEELKKVHGICIAKNEQEAVQLLLLCKTETQWARSLGERALQMAGTSSGIAKDYLKKLQIQQSL